MTIFFKCPICLEETCSFSDHKEHTSKCLRPCPFCGGAASYVYGDMNTSLHHIECYNEDCKIQPGTYYFEWDEKDEYIEAWNKRA